MELEVAKAIVDALENEGEEAVLRENYSGRAMYGATTVGVVCDHFAFLITAIINNAHLFTDSVYGEPKFDTECFRTDSMGRGVIVY